MSAIKQALIIAIFVGLIWYMRAVHMAYVMAECPSFSTEIPSDHPPEIGYPTGFTGHLGPDYWLDSNIASNFRQSVHSADNLDKMMSDFGNSDVRRSEEPHQERQHFEQHSHSETKQAHYGQKHRKHMKAGHEKHKHKHSTHSMDGHDEHDHEHHAHKMKKSGTQPWTGI